MKKLILFVMLAFSPVLAQAAGGGCGELEKCEVAPVNHKDRVSLQNGAKLFMNYCAGCHSAKYQRYERTAVDLGIDPKLVEEHLMFTGDKIGGTINAGTSAKDQAKWFGSAPPDLTMVTRLRTPDWVYSYLNNFYVDEARPYGVNNRVFKDVAMPHVMYDLEQELAPEDYKQAIGDLVNFMAYMAEPIKAERERLGVFVLLFLAILMIPVWFLNKEYWKDVK